MGRHLEQRARHRRAASASRRRCSPRRRAGRTRASRTRTAAARWRARRPRAAHRTSPPCPAAAPAASRILRSDGETRMTCPSSDPSAPPVTMIGPSAPNGAPVPIAIAAETGFATAVRGAMRLCLVSTASIASGMPCPRITGRPSRQQADEERAEHGGDEDLRPGMKLGERRRLPTPLLEQREVGDEADQVDQHPRGDAAEQAEHRGERGEQEQPARRRHNRRHRATILS